MKRKIWAAIISVFLIFILWNWALIRYGLQQAKGQIEIIVNAKPIDEFLEDPDFPDSLKSKLRLSKEVRSFAMDRLKLNHSDNYTKLYDQKGKVLLWNLSACEPYALKPYQWSFPFLGDMPYKGFFDIEKAKKERSILDSLGYDTRIRPVGGWSTLGILNDPILSNMLTRSDGALAELIIHELTHATVFVKNEIEFNENLATFIGERGAEIFLKEKFGDSSQVLLDYQQGRGDGSKLNNHILKGAKLLEQLYSEFSNESDRVKSQRKYELINEIVNTLDTVSFYNQRYYQLFEKAKPNNAYFMSFKRYHAKEDTLNTLYQNYNQDLFLMIDEMKSLYGK